MKIRTSIIAAAAAVALGTTGALVFPAVASAHSASTTLKFIAVQKATVSFTKTNWRQPGDRCQRGGQDCRLRHDLLRGHLGDQCRRERHLRHQGRVPDGTATVSIKTGAITDGKVAGGTGAFKGATGTIKVKAISSTKHAVTITYSG